MGSTGDFGVPVGQKGPEEAEAVFTDRLPFCIFVAVTTSLNIVALGVEQEMSTMSDRSFSVAIWWVIGGVFSVCFTMELFIRAVVGKKRFFADAWNVADVLLVAAFVLDTFVLVPAGIGGQVRFFTVFRALRMVQIVRLIRMYPSFRELWLLVGGLSNSIKALGWSAMVIVLLLYVCAIVVTAQIGHNQDLYGSGPSYNGEVWPYESYFGTVPLSMFTLFQVLTLDGWCDDVVRHVIYREPLMGVFFVAFVLITAFGVMNVVVGIIVENTLAAAQVVDKKIEERHGTAKKVAVEELYEILDRLDSSRSGHISLEALWAANQSDIIQEKFGRIGLGSDEVEQIFKLLDVSKSGVVSIRRFAESCRELVGGAKRRDIAQVEVTMGALAQRLEKLDEQFSVIETEVGLISGMAADFVSNTVRVLTGFDGQAAKGS